MGSHLLVYDYDWWVLGQKAKIIQRFHPDLDIMSIKEITALTNKRGANYINTRYEQIATLGLGIAQILIRLHIRVDASQIGSYNYITKNHQTFREWQDVAKPNHSFSKQVMTKPDQLGAINPNLALEVKKQLPHKNVTYLRPFVDSDRFHPAATRQQPKEMVIGWVGNEHRKVKNYHTLYRAIVKAFRNHPHVTFVEATRSSPVQTHEMPGFYRNLDLLLITSSNEGGPAPALEAYACGVPVLSTNVGYVQAVAGPRNKSLILNSKNPKPFVKKIEELSKDQDLHASLKKEARDHIVNHFTVEKAIGVWLKTLFNVSPFFPKE
ncbi:glycosyltransferase family 4 protein [Natribacillus halophilus]|uniref:Glycosyltransferase involved in cell wall bisynthesis n=1 Tax=Natribacillus halophilus TaxID=549003 RepID=A0A1G8P259_9BACI|nr:glycosyltransferase [Natribacillus halophilus]SDI86358.1 Glycosyltransferase involved in cell wall bisynthesis [Natribacillus halophilus]